MTAFAPDCLHQRVALITGGGTGIGKAIAQTLGAHGARIVICSRKQEVLNVARAELQAQGIECLAMAADVRDAAAVEAVVAATLARFGRLDMVINNAAGNFPASIENLSYNGFRTVVDIDLQGTYQVSKAVYHAWLKDHGGVVVNISAPFEHLGVSYQAHVAAAKAGVDALTRTCAVEWAQKGIRVNSVAPGFIANTEGVARLGQVAAENPNALRGEARDIANTVLFLCSDAARFVSGVCMRVDGASTIDLMRAVVD